MNECNKELWIRMINIFNIIDLNKYKKLTIDDFKNISYNIDYIYQNRNFLEGNKFSVWKSFIKNNLIMIIKNFINDEISIELKKIRITKSMAAIHLNNNIQSKIIAQEIYEKVNEICE